MAFSPRDPGHVSPGAPAVAWRRPGGAVPDRTLQCRMNTELPAGDPATAPYARLTPDLILDALASVGLLGDGRLLALNSYENRVYMVWIEDAQPVVVKFYRPARWTDGQILEEHGFAAELVGHEVPVVAPLAIGGRTLFEFEGFRFAVFPRQGGRAPELDNPDVLERIGRFIGRFHAVGRAGRFAGRPVLDPQRFGHEPRNWLVEHDFVPAELRQSWSAAIDMALERVDRIWGEVGDVARLRLHGDCHAGNVLWTDTGAHFVDLDDCLTGPAMQDLWMLLSGDRQAMSVQLEDVLAGYEDFMEFDARELRLVEPLRTLRLIHYSAWIARRWTDPAFPAAFPWFNTQRYWQDRILELREQIGALDDAPLERLRP